MDGGQSGGRGNYSGQMRENEKFQDFATIVAGSTSGAVRRVVLFGLRFAF